MNNHSLHLVAERILREVGQLDNSGYLTEQYVDVDHLVEVGLGLQVVGSSPRGQWRLKKRSLGALDLDHKKIVVNGRVMDSQDEEPRYRQILAHEAAHALLHSKLPEQLQLPFEGAGNLQLRRAKLGFSQAMKVEIEHEANVLGALLLIPEAEMVTALAPCVARYACLVQAANLDFKKDVESKAALDYQAASIQVLCERFCVPESVAKIALDYWNALIRPPHSWRQRLSIFEQLENPSFDVSGEDKWNCPNFIHFGRNFQGNMRVIAFRKLRDFYEQPGREDAEQPLRAWFKEAEQAKWTCWADIKTFYSSADAPGNNRIVFNIGGNKYRLIVSVDYRWGKVYIRWIGTHAEYDKLSDVRKL